MSPAQRPVLLRVLTSNSIQLTANKVLQDKIGQKKNLSYGLT